MFYCLFVDMFNTYHAQFKITSLEYTEEMANKTSDKYKKLAAGVTTVVCITVGISQRLFQSVKMNNYGV